MTKTQTMQQVVMAQEIINYWKQLKQKDKETRRLQKELIKIYRAYYDNTLKLNAQLITQQDLNTAHNAYNKSFDEAIILHGKISSYSIKQNDLPEDIRKLVERVQQ